MGQTERKLCGERESSPGQGQLGECQSLALGQGMGPASATQRQLGAEGQVWPCASAEAGR